MKLDATTIVLMTLLAGALPTLVATIIGSLLRRAISNVDQSISELRAHVAKVTEKMESSADRLARLEERMGALEQKRWWRGRK